MRESDEIWVDPDAPGRMYMRRLYESATVGLSLALFFYWVAWEWSSWVVVKLGKNVELDWDPGTSKLFKI